MVFSNKPSHLKALLRKNWILLKRSPCLTICELLVPFIFAALTISIRQALPPEITPQTTYFTDPKWNIAYDGILDGSDLLLFKDCNSPEIGGKVALAPRGDAIVTQLDYIFGNIY